MIKPALEADSGACALKERSQREQPLDLITALGQKLGCLKQRSEGAVLGRCSLARSPVK